MGDKYSASLSGGKCFEVVSGETILEASIRRSNLNKRFGVSHKKN